MRGESANQFSLATVARSARGAEQEILINNTKGAETELAKKCAGKFGLPRGW